MKRTDIHRPSEIVPDDYEFVACEHLKIQGFGDCEYVLAMRKLIEAHMIRTGGNYSNHEHGGNCHVCGSPNLIYSILYYHAPTNSYIRVGEDCAQKLDMGGTKEMSRFRAAVRDALEAQAGKKKAVATLEAAGLTHAWEIYTEPDAVVRQGWKYEETTIIDIVDKLVRFGSISEKQTAFLAKLLDKIPQRAAIAAQRAAETAAAAPCPIGRVTVVGEILTVREQDSNFGMGYKMLVRADSGFKVWVTCPGGYERKRGERVSFNCALTPSNDDPKFGFGKRPTKFEVLSQPN